MTPAEVIEAVEELTHLKAYTEKEWHAFKIQNHPLNMLYWTELVLCLQVFVAILLLLSFYSIKWKNHSNLCKVINPFERFIPGSESGSLLVWLGFSYWFIKSNQFTVALLEYREKKKT